MKAARHRAPFPAVWLMLLAPLFGAHPGRASALRFDAAGGILFPVSRAVLDNYGKFPCALASASVPWISGSLLFVEAGYLGGSGQDRITGPTFDLAPARLRAFPVIVGIRPLSRPDPGRMDPYLDVLAGAGPMFVRWEDPLTGAGHAAPFVMMAELRPTFPLRPGLDFWFGARGSVGGKVYLSKRDHDLSGIRIQTGLSLAPR